jgi:hypothetical protein
MGSGSSVNIFLSLCRVPIGHEQEWKSLGVSKRHETKDKRCKTMSVSFPAGWSIVHNVHDMRHASYHDNNGRIRVLAFYDADTGVSWCRFLSDGEIKTYTNTERGRANSCASLKEPIPFSLMELERSILSTCRRESCLDFNFNTIKIGVPPGNVQRQTDASIETNELDQDDNVIVTNTHETDANEIELDLLSQL